MSDKMFVVVNPVSANKTTKKEWPEFEKKLKESGYSFDIAFTEYPEHATELTRKAINQGYRTIMSVGGDGTMNEVLNGFFDENGISAEDARLVVFSRGTGCDFIKSLGIKKGIEDLLGVLERNSCKKLDVGRIKFVGRNGSLKTRYFLNVADIGIGAETANRVNMHSKILRGFLSFLIGAVATIVLYRNKPFNILIDDNMVLTGRMNSVIVANGKYFGGGMMVAPEASMEDGVFDIITFGDLGKLDLIKSFPLIYSGKHLSHPKVKLHKGSKVKVTCGRKALLEIDGELPGSPDAEFEILTKILNVIA
ncbi:MAG: diacylglycerol/lipid kinase family protein [Caulobacteraceae bacterium]